MIRKQYFKEKLESLFECYKNRGVMNTLNHILSHIYRILFGMLSMSWRAIYYRIKWPNSYPCQYKIISVEPSKVEHAVRPQLSKDYSNFGYHILDGDWDKPQDPDSKQRGKIHFSNYIFYRSMVDHFDCDITWDKTDFFNAALHNSTNYRGESKSETMTEIKKIENLFKNISQNGYKQQHHLSDSDINILSKMFFTHDEVKLNISREGNFLFEDGRHRISIAKILELDKIPVRVVARHKKWQLIREQISNCDSRCEIVDKFSKELLDHPDLQDVLPNRGI